jgi:hypothetical protein
VEKYSINLYHVVVSQEDDGTWRGRRLVEEQSPASPEWKAHMLSQHPAEESDVIVMRKRIFGLIAVGGCKCLDSKTIRPFN